MSSIKQFTRGGQIMLHNLRMIYQIWSWFLYLAIFIYIFGSLYLLNYFEPHLIETIKLLATSSYAYLKEIMYPNSTVSLYLKGNRFELDTQTLLNLPYLHEEIARFKLHLKWSLLISFLFSAIVLWLSSSNLKKQGERQAEGKFIRGAEVVPENELINQLKDNQECGDYKIGGVPLVKNSECQHILISGSTGSGKSVCFKDFMTQIKDQGHRAIIFDKGCALIKHFYEKSDIILNPFDKRSALWSIWGECRESSDFEAIAESLIPDSPGRKNDQFFIRAARNLLIDVANNMYMCGENRTSILLNELFAENLKILQKRVKGTSSEALLSERVDKTALNVKSELSNCLKSLMYLDDTEDPFSIRSWLHNDEPSWLYITSDGSRHDALKPLISAWLNIAIKETLSLPLDESRRIFILLDELPSLNCLPMLSHVVSEGRKFGVSVVMGIQNIGQLRDIYGLSGSEAIVGQANTRLYMRSPESDTAEWVSRNLGTFEYEETSENVSYGANTIRDGVSVGRSIREKRLVLPSEVMRLPDLTGYLKLKGNYPISMVKLKYIDYPTVTEAIDVKISALSREKHATILSDDQHINTGDKKEIPSKEKTKVAIEEFELI